MNENELAPACRAAAKAVGIWIAGARGDLATTLMVGTRALARGLVSTLGMTTALQPIARLPLARPNDLLFGGLDISAIPLREAAEGLYRRSRTIDRELLDAVAGDLAGIERDLYDEPAFGWNPLDPPVDHPPLELLITGLRRRMRAFRERHSLDRLVVVNLMSSLPHPQPSPRRESAAGITELIERDRKELLSPSVCYAWAALSEGCPYINFTPNAGTDWGGIAELAARNRVPFYGDDGKTGETLVKTALAHLFAYRNLEVMSWEGVNLLGNNDGRVLDEPRNREVKLHNKEGVLSGILGYTPHAGVTINYVPSLGDWKTAWDLIHFRGFLGVPMTMQFVWQGCDSILAAPLVLDLVRLADFAARRGEQGPSTHLAAFFKHPLGVEEMDFHRQYQMLQDYAEGHLTDLQGT